MVLIILLDMSVERRTMKNEWRHIERQEEKMRLWNVVAKLNI